MGWIRECLVERKLGFPLNNIQKVVLNLPDVRGLIIVARLGMGVTTAITARLSWLNPKNLYILDPRETLKFPGAKYTGPVGSDDLFVVDNADEVKDFTTIMAGMIACKSWILAGELSSIERDTNLFRIYTQCDTRIQLPGKFSGEVGRTVGIKCF